MNLFEEEIVAFFSILNSNKVKFILVGGLAVNYHGFSRSTGDIDLWIEDSEANRKLLVNALLEYKVEGAEAFLSYPLIAGYAEVILENGIYIDLMADLQFFKQENFIECYDMSNIFSLKENVNLKVLHINKLIQEKESSQRAKDVEDAKQLTKLNRK